jgi:UPF0148 protein
MPRRMAIQPNSNQNSGKLKDAASLLLKGATLLNEPCPSCAGVQVRFQNKNICINRCDLQDVAAEPPQKESIPTHDDMMMNTNRDLLKSIVQEKIMLLVQQLRDQNDLSSQKARAELIELYLRILEKAEALEDPTIQTLRGYF